MIDFKPFFHRLRLVICADHQLRTADVTDSIVLRRIILYMVCRPTLRTNSSSTHAPDDILILDLDIDCIIDRSALLLQSIGQSVSLIQRSWKPIQNISILAVVL